MKIIYNIDIVIVVLSVGLGVTIGSTMSSVKHENIYITNQVYKVDRLTITNTYSVPRSMQPIPYICTNTYNSFTNYLIKCSSPEQEIRQ